MRSPVGRYRGIPLHNFQEVKGTAQEDLLLSILAAFLSDGRQCEKG